MIIEINSSHVDLMMGDARHLDGTQESDLGAATESTIDWLAEYGYSPEGKSTGTVQSLIEIGYLLALRDVRS